MTDDQMKTFDNLGDILDYFFSLHPMEKVRIVREDGKSKVVETYEEARRFWAKEDDDDRRR